MTGIIALACAVLIAVFWAGRSYYVLICASPSSDPDLLVYTLDGARRLVVGRDVALLINAREQVVLSLSVVGRRWGRAVLWPRDAMKGVVLGEPVKGHAEDSYQFSASGVDIVYSTSARKNVLHVDLGAEP